MVAAMTMPVLIQNHQKNVLKQQFKKSYSLMQQAYQKVFADNGYNYECYYWDKNPYGNSVCTKYNDATKDKMGDILPVEITVYDDRTFDFVIKTPPAAFLIKKAAKIKSGSAKGSKEIVAKITKEQLKEIAETKLPDLNAYTVEEAMKIVEGTALNMGVEISE